MPFNINDILSAVNNKGGLLKSANFEARINVPATLRGSFNSQDISIMCMNATLPGYSFQTSPIKMYGYGVPENRPVQGVLSDISATFFCDAEAETLRFFHEWLRLVQNYNAEETASTQYRGAHVYDFQYPTTYETIMAMLVYNETGELSLAYKIGGAYPTNVNSTEVNWSDADNILKVTVNFAYHWWNTDAFTTGSRSGTAGSSTTRLQRQDASTSRGLSRDNT